MSGIWTESFFGSTEIHSPASLSSLNCSVPGNKERIQNQVIVGEHLKNILTRAITRNQVGEFLVVFHFDIERINRKAPPFLMILNLREVWKILLICFCFQTSSYLHQLLVVIFEGAGLTRGTDQQSQVETETQAEKHLQSDPSKYWQSGKTAMTWTFIKWGPCYQTLINNKVRCWTRW